MDRQMGLHERYEPTPRERRAIEENKRWFKKYIEPADKKKLWALITDRSFEDEIRRQLDAMPEPQRRICIRELYERSKRSLCHHTTNF